MSTIDVTDPPLVDTTLRDGEQAAGVRFGRNQALEIALELADAGLREIEVGIPAMGWDEQEKIRSIVRALPAVRCSAWCRARIDDLVAAADTGVDLVHISLPVSPIQLNALGRDWNWIKRQLGELIPWARQHFARVSIGAQDASRCPAKQLIEFGRLVDDWKVDRLRLADTVGIWNPIQCHNIVSSVVEAIPRTPIAVHCHDDLGMATANSVVALHAGARSVDVTVNGLGERAGNAALEEVAMALEMAQTGGSGLITERFVTLSTLVARYSGRASSPSKAVVGAGAFSHESGIHVHAMLRDARAYEPFAPERVGHSGRRFVLGKHSGATARAFLHAQSGVGAAKPRKGPGELGRDASLESSVQSTS